MTIEESGRATRRWLTSCSNVFVCDLIVRSDHRDMWRPFQPYKHPAVASPEITDNHRLYRGIRRTRRVKPVFNAAAGACQYRPCNAAKSTLISGRVRAAFLVNILTARRFQPYNLRFAVARHQSRRFPRLAVSHRPRRISDCDSEFPDAISRLHATPASCSNQCWATLA